MAMHLFHPDAMLSNKLRCRNTAIAKLKAIAPPAAVIQIYKHSCV